MVLTPFRPGMVEGGFTEASPSSVMTRIGRLAIAIGLDEAVANALG